MKYKATYDMLKVWCIGFRYDETGTYFIDARKSKKFYMKRLDGMKIERITPNALYLDRTQKAIEWLEAVIEKPDSLKHTITIEELMSTRKTQKAKCEEELALRKQKVKTPNPKRHYNMMVFDRVVDLRDLCDVSNLSADKEVTIYWNAIRPNKIYIIGEKAISELAVIPPQKDQEYERLF